MFYILLTFSNSNNGFEFGSHALTVISVLPVASLEEAELKFCELVEDDAICDIEDIGYSHRLYLDDVLDLLSEEYCLFSNISDSEIESVSYADNSNGNSITDENINCFVGIVVGI